MNTRITRATLENLLSEIGAKSNKATSHEQAKQMGVDKFLQLEYASCYGGWRVVNVGVANGAHYGAFGGNGCEARLSAAKMYEKLNGILAGIETVTAH